LTTVIARVCLDLLRARRSRREEGLDAAAPAPAAAPDPEEEAALADSVGVALLVVLDTLAPAERLAFVLHDLFGPPSEAIAPIVGRSRAAPRQLARRARRRVQGAAERPKPALARQRALVETFLAALRGGDVDALLAVLDPEFVVRADTPAPGQPAEVRGAENWVKGAVQFRRGARFAQAALLDGTVGVIIAPKGKLFRALRFHIAGDKIAEIEVIGDPARLAQLELAVLQ